MTRANLLLIRELNVNGDGDFADVMIQLERPLTPEQKRALRVELTRSKFWMTPTQIPLWNLLSTIF